MNLGVIIENNSLKITQSIYSTLASTIRSLINCGVKSGSIANFEAIQSINMICLFLIAGSVFYALQWGVFNYYPLMVLSLMFSINYSFCFVWMRIGKPNYAAYHCLISAIVHFSVYSIVIFNRDAGYQWFLIAIIPASFLMIPSASRWHHVAFSLVAMLVIIVSETGIYGAPIYTFPAELRTLSILIEGLFLVIGLNLTMQICNHSIDKYQSKLVALGQKDELTDIANRRFFMSSIKQLAQKEQSNYFILTLDLDHFKKLNDQYGHAVGDQALINVANTINTIIPNGSLLARLGGEEFAILLYSDTKDHAIAISNNIRLAIAEHSITTSKGEKVNCTTSIGISPLTLDFSASMQLSDKALYQAKENGRNCVVFLNNIPVQVENNEYKN